MLSTPINKTIGSPLDHLPGYFVQKNADSIYSFANKNAATILGFDSPEEMIGKTDHELKCNAAQYADCFAQEDQLALEKGKLQFISHFCYAKNEWKTCFYEKTGFKNAGGDVAGVSCYVTDVTDCHLIDITRFLLKTDSKSHYEFMHRQFSYVLNQHYFDVRLTGRETECLFFILRGKSSKAIARFLNVSVKTIEYYIEQLKTKMNCSNKSELIEKSIFKGYLNILPNSLINNQLINKMKND